MPMKLIIQEIIKYLIVGISLAINNAANVMVILTNFIYIGRLEDPLIQASFGLGVSYYMFLFMSLNLGCYEVTGIQCAKIYGSGYLKGMSETLGKGFCLLGLIYIFSITMFWFSPYILIGIGIAEENAHMTGTMVRWMIPGMILQGINFQFMSFCMGQNITKPFGLANIFNVAICAALGGWLVNDCQVGIMLFPICKFLMEIVNGITVLICCLSQIEKGSLQWVPWANVKYELGIFLWTGMKFILA